MLRTFLLAAAAAMLFAAVAVDTTSRPGEEIIRSISRLWRAVLFLA